MDALTAAVREEFLVEIKRLDAENARLRDALEWVRAHYASGSTKEINARIEAALKGEDL